VLIGARCRIRTGTAGSLHLGIKTADPLQIRPACACLGRANQRAREFTEARWGTREGRWALAPGKAVTARLAEWSQAIFGVGFGPEQLARALDASEIDSELAETIRAIPASRRLAQPTGAATVRAGEV
jgi:hypothetical protein